jgi:hypothetical protein
MTIRWVEFAWGEIKTTCRILVGKPAGKYHLGNLDVHGRMILKCIVNKQGASMWTGFNCASIESSGGIL